MLEMAVEIENLGHVTVGLSLLQLHPHATDLAVEQAQAERLIGTADAVPEVSDHLVSPTDSEPRAYQVLQNLSSGI